MATEDVLDVCFVGAGIANLYLAYRLLRERRILKYAVLEKSKRVGGRIHSSTWNNVVVERGAGIARDRDRLLLALIKELRVDNVVLDKQPAARVRADNLPPMDGDAEIVQKWRAMLERATISGGDQKTSKTFRQLGLEVLGPAELDKMVAGTGYTDYLDADALDTLTHYGAQDLVGGGSIVRVRWQQLLDRLYDFVGGLYIRTGCAVRQISASGNVYALDTSRGPVRCRHLVLGVPASAVQRLLKLPIYGQVRAQPFARVYALIDPNRSKAFVDAVGAHAVVPAPLCKIIRIMENLYMIAYCDNDNAEFVRKNVCATKTPKDRLAYLSKLIKYCTGKHAHLLDTIMFFWKEGTHYFLPLQRELFRSREAFLEAAQQPGRQRVFVVGEAFSNNQGWVEGALESAEAVLPKLRASLLSPKPTR